ncbi:MAG: DUF1015 domain-containing protein [bacterium]
MAEIRPLRGIRYNPVRVPDLNRVATQPYDKVSPEMKQAYLAADPYNFVRLILPDSYEESDRLCRRWLSEGVFVRDNTPALYAYHEEFEAQGTRHVRKGFIGLLRVDEFEKGTVLPHERTLSKAKADRLNLARATRKDYEQIFMLYSDPSREVDRLLDPVGEPDLKVTDEYGVRHRAWTITDPAAIAAVRARLANEVMLIADGHHRYETALNLRKEIEAADSGLSPDAAVRFKACAFVNVADPGLVILPTHRFLKNLGEVDWSSKTDEIGRAFRVTAVVPGRAEAKLKAAAGGNAFVLHAGRGRTWLLELTDRAAVERAAGPKRSADYLALDVVVLHSVVIEGIFGVTPDRIEHHVKYERDWNRAIERVDAGEFQAVLLMNPTRSEQVRCLAERGERMPQKSTDFYPKLISGLVFADIGPDETV